MLVAQDARNTRREMLVSVTVLVRRWRSGNFGFTTTSQAPALSAAVLRPSAPVMTSPHCNEQFMKSNPGTTQTAHEAVGHAVAARTRRSIAVAHATGVKGVAGAVARARRDARTPAHAAGFEDCATSGDAVAADWDFDPRNQHTCSVVLQMYTLSACLTNKRNSATLDVRICSTAQFEVRSKPRSVSTATHQARSAHSRVAKPF